MTGRGLNCLKVVSLAPVRAKPAAKEEMEWYRIAFTFVFDNY